MQGTQTIVSLNSRFESHQEEEARTWAASLAADAAAEVSEAASALHALLSLLCHRR